ncbi:unnamed protein product [Urochloa decumbens]|uniref:F-box domain-containing protein n=1 Tax=Urochloa decumbens TaxID=240449 RepID=A0ABC8YXG7_9POAL
MEPRARHTSKRGAMAAAAAGEDRLSGLPDDLLHSILRVLPLKHAASTSALSRRWARRWMRSLASSPAIDFTDRDFARGQPPSRAAATVTRCLRLHAEHGAPLHAFRVALGSVAGAGALGLDVVGWVAAAVARGARDVEVDLTPPPPQEEDDADHGSAAFLEIPGDLFLAENSLERLALGGRFGLRAVPAGAAGLAGLRSLSLSDADVTDEAVRAMVSGCGALELLSLRRCRRLTSVRVIAGERLRVLEIVGCLAVRALQVAAPALESFAFHGDIVCSSDPDEEEDAGGVLFGATPALRDAYLSHLGFGDYDDYRHDFAYSNFLECIAHANVLTLCSVGLLPRICTRGGRAESTRAAAADALSRRRRRGASPPVSSSSLFQSWIASSSLLGGPADAGGAAASSPAAGEDEHDIVPNVDIVLDHLTLIKVVNIRGTRCELRLLRFLMNRAPVLEQLVLVTAEEEGPLGGEEIKAIQMRVPAMRTASPEARVTVCRPGKDGSRNPAHAKLYHEQ